MMVEPREAFPVKGIVGLLYSDRRGQEEALERLEELLGPLDHRSAEFPFRVSRYYEAELGTEPVRRFVSARKLIPADRLADLKLETFRIEQELALEGRRRVNLDPGLLDYGKVILASFKEAPHKIYLGRGVWADLLLHRYEGSWRPLDWSFPDFKSNLYRQTFEEIRLRYRTQRRQLEER